MIKIKIEKPFKLEDTITCGQIFRFFKMNDGSFDIILSDRVINVYQKDNYLYATSNCNDNLKTIIINYFDLDNDYNEMNHYLLSQDKKLEDAINFSNGLMMIRQNAFETIMEYIISANNSVPSIANSLNIIAKKYGKKVIFNNKEYYLFPQYKDLKDITEADLRECKVGFRDRYLVDIISDIVENRLNVNYIFEMNSEDSLRYLMSFRGIGMKVASCILLFAYQKYDVYPIDTWVKKYMDTNYGFEDEKKIKEFCKEKYGKYSGLAIQYMFNGMRNM